VAIVEILLFACEHRNSKPSEHGKQDPLIVACFEQVLNGLVYELYFPDELHEASLHLFDLVKKAKLPDIEATAESERLEVLRDKFEDLYDGNHPLRIALDKLQTLDTVRIIEGKA
jgi:adenine-specific DNA-methyltransferase